MKNKFYIFPIIGLALIFSATLRFWSFYLPHNNYDSIFYLTLAMKLDKYGLDRYNLKGVDLIHDINVTAIVSSQDREKGSLLEMIEKNNVFYYSKESLSNMPPAYSFLLMLSHRILSSGRPYLYINRNLGLDAFFLKPIFFLQTQFYAVWINFVFSMLFILAVFIMGKVFFNEKVGLWASLMIVIAPVDILTSARLWNDEMVSFFSILCVLLFWQGRKTNNLFIIIFSGLSAGIAALTKPSGLFIVAVIVFSFILIEAKHAMYERKFLNIKNAVLNKYLIIFVLTSISIAALWYVKIALTYGVPWYMPHQEGIEKVTAWFMMLSRRSRYGQLLYFVYLLPLFGFFYVEAVKTIFRRIFTDERIIMLVWVFVFLLVLIIIKGKEERYMLPAYPAIAIFSAVAIENIRTRLNGSMGRIRFIGNITVILLFFLATMWSANLGVNCVLDNGSIFNLF